QVTWGSMTRTDVAADGNWSVSFLPPEVPADGSRPVTATVIDAAGNPSAPASFDVVVDRAGTCATISGDTSATINAPVTLTVTFSEPVIGFGAEDLTIGNGSVTNVSGSGASYSVTIAPGATDGPMSVVVNAGGATDQAGNGNSASTAATLTVDRTGPVPAIVLPGGTATGPFTVVINFNEAVAGFAAGDVSVTNGTAAGSFSGGNNSTSFELVVTPTPGTTGSVAIAVLAGVATDALGNPSSAAPQVTQPFDTSLPPTLDIEDQTAAATTNAPVTFTFEFSDPVAGFDTDDIDVSGGSKGALVNSGDDQNFTMVITPTPGVQNGSIAVSVDAGTYTNQAGTPSETGENHSQAYDTRQPPLSITNSAPDPTTGAVTFTFDFDE